MTCEEVLVAETLRIQNLVCNFFKQADDTLQFAAPERTAASMFLGTAICRSDSFAFSNVLSPVPLGHFSSWIHFFLSLIFEILSNAKSLLEN